MHSFTNSLYTHSLTRQGVPSQWLFQCSPHSNSSISYEVKCEHSADRKRPRVDNAYMMQNNVMTEPWTSEYYTNLHLRRQISITVPCDDLLSHIDELYVGDLLVVLVILDGLVDLLVGTHAVQKVLSSCGCIHAFTSPVIEYHSEIVQ